MQSEKVILKYGKSHKTHSRLKPVDSSFIPPFKRRVFRLPKFSDNGKLETFHPSQLKKIERTTESAESTESTESTEPENTKAYAQHVFQKDDLVLINVRNGNASDRQHNGKWGIVHNFGVSGSIECKVAGTRMRYKKDDLELMENQT